MIDALKNIVGSKNVLYDGLEKSRIAHIWDTDTPLRTKGVILPKTTLEVSKILQLCYEKNEEIIVHGGLTNLVGGTQVQPHQWVISLEKMNAIEDLDESAKTVTAQSGVILEHIIAAAHEKGLFLPLQFGARGSAQIGGVVSTNAGGMRVFRYGMTRSLVLGLEVVLPSGAIISSLKKILKDNSGYDLKQLFIGSEGTLGVVTKVCLRLFESPTTRYAALVAVQTFDDVIRLLRFMEKQLSGNLTAFELMWKTAYNAATATKQQSASTLSKDFPFYVFIESMGYQLGEDYEKFEYAITAAIEKGLVADGVMAQSAQEVNSLWMIREDTHALTQPYAFSQHFDISLPIGVMDKEIATIVKHLNALPYVQNVFPFGHIADGNIHLIVGKKDSIAAHTKQINDIVYKNLRKHQGSVSAEHGIGLDKKAFLKTSKSDQEIALMKTIKQSLDPKNFLNPGRIF